MTTPQVGATTLHPTVPYMTTAMWKAEPTGLAPDQLVAGGTPQQQEDQLAREILKASSEMDLFVYGASGGVLRATTDTETVRVRMGRDGFFRLSPRLTPVRALTGFFSGDDPAAMTQLADLSHVEVEPARIRVPAYPFTGTSSEGPLQFGVMASTAYDSLVTYSYVNGWPLTSLTTAASAGAVTITVDDATGIYTGGRLVIRDPLAGDESVTVSAVTGSDVSVSALVRDHAAGVQVDGLPQALIDSCTEITTGLIKRRSQQSVRVMRRAQANSTALRTRGQPGGYLAPESPGQDNFTRGFALLQPFAQVRTR